jgi:hypothetical protein
MVTPTIITQSGVGYNSAIILQPGSTDRHGVIYVSTGTSPSPFAGLFYLRFAVWHNKSAVCLIPLSESAKRLHMWSFFPTNHYGFEIYGPREGLEASTTYVWRYRIGFNCNVRE